MSIENRPWQEKIIRRIVDVDANRIILESPTGSGKTMIALSIIRELVKTKRISHAYVAVRTHSQLRSYDRDIKKFEIPIVYKPVIGKKLGCPYYEEGDDENNWLCDACLQRTYDKDLHEVTYDEENARRVIRNINAELPQGLDHLLQNYVTNKKAQICLYHSLKQIPSTLDIITYQYLVNPEIRKAHGIDLEHSLIIVDEAHNLGDTGKLDQNASISSLRGNLREFQSREFQSKCFGLLEPGWEEEWGNNLEITVQRITQVFLKYGVIRRSKTNEDEKEVRIDKLAFAEEIDSDPETRNVISTAYKAVNKVKKDLAARKYRRGLRNPFSGITKFIDSLGDDDYELFTNGFGNFSLKLLDPAPFLSPLNRSGMLILMSGTMPSADYVEKAWGIRECVEIRTLQDYSEDYYGVFPRDARNNVFLTNVSSQYPSLKSTDTIKKYAEIAETAFDKGRLSTLVCCTNRKAAENIGTVITRNKYIENRQTSLRDVFARIQQERIIIIGYARGKIMEGVELVKQKESLIDSVVIAGIPYPVPDDLHKWRMKKVIARIGSRYDGNFELFSMIPALTIVRQAAGRAIRFPGDKATIYFADKRFQDYEWRNRIT